MKIKFAKKKTLRQIWLKRGLWFGFWMFLWQIGENIFHRQPIQWTETIISAMVMGAGFVLVSVLINKIELRNPSIAWDTPNDKEPNVTSLTTPFTIAEAQEIILANAQKAGLEIEQADSDRGRVLLSEEGWALSHDGIWLPISLTRLDDKTTLLRIAVKSKVWPIPSRRILERRRERFVRRIKSVLQEQTAHVLLRPAEAEQLPGTTLLRAAKSSDDREPQQLLRAGTSEVSNLP